MPFTIRIHPSGKRFLSEGRSTLLEAGLHAGLALNYGCSNGNCGHCLARIIEGDVKKVRHHDYAISEQQRFNRYVLMCSHAALSDVTLEAPEAGDSTEIPRQQITARVRHLEIVSGNVALLHLKTPRTKRLRFLAGQKVQLVADGLPGAEHFVSSCPCDDMNLHFQIPRRNNDAFSDHVFESIKKGDPIDIDGPFGDFVLNEDSPNELAFIAWRTGFAPVKSLIEHAMALELNQPIHLLWIADSHEHRYQHNLCRSWQDAFDNFNYSVLDITSGRQKTVEAGVLEHLNIRPEKLENFDFYLADDQGFTSKSTGKLTITE